MKKIVSLLIFLCLCICISTVYAADMTVTLNKSVNEINKGEEVTVEFKVNDVNLEKGVDTLIATLSYDTNVFEKVEKANISAKNAWNSPSFRSDNGKIIIQRDEPMKTNDTIFSITFKAKQTAILGNSAIKLSDINLSEGTENYFPANVETTICIKEILGNNPEDNNKPGDTAEPTPTPTAKPTQSDTEKPTPTANTTQSSTAKPGETTTNNKKPTVLPKAGASRTLIIFISILLVASILGYIKCKKYRKI